MIDYIKAYFLDKGIVENRILEMSENSDGIYKVDGNYNFNNDNSEYPIRTKIENLRVSISEKTGYIENSLHKFYNKIIYDESHNHNDFNYENLVYALKEMENVLCYPLDQFKLTNLEFGFNIDLGINPTDVLKNNFLMYKFKAPCYDPKNFGQMKIKKFTYNNYEIKVYNKSLQYNLKGDLSNILRIEVKYKTRKELNPLGVFTLSDLLKKECLLNLFKDFRKKVDQLIIVDRFDGSNEMNPNQRQYFTICTNPNYWISMEKTTHKSTVVSRKNRFNNMVEEYGVNEWRSVIFSLITKKFQKLLGSVERYNPSTISIE